MKKNILKFGKSLSREEQKNIHGGRTLPGGGGGYLCVLKTGTNCPSGCVEKIQDGGIYCCEAEGHYCDFNETIE